ncbi:hypothetical protein CROQUDRAFT_107180 [Cronartium quercuum f. sp. fusiforme G11]|uniref:Uncharacterized protein n=1 Tax=Cronartium quercuum f. sp. fusiforme G11 TaxID=708437 RepID=A0A9P6NLM6_9BASI|nr:hypothetical protein CROQUDRAFT_107180 [Cronartium quercuum f. sp. fusiforme G11]
MELKVAIKIVMILSSACSVITQQSPIHSLCYKRSFDGYDPNSGYSATGVQIKEKPISCGVFTEKDRRGYGADDLFIPEEADGYETEDPAYFLDSGHGICGQYKSNSTRGVCLWTGTDPSGSDPKQAGWLNGALDVNCKKNIWIMRENQAHTRQIARVIDGCAMNTYNISDANSACQQVYLSEKLYYDFDPTDEELQSGSISDLVWNFADGTENRPV